MDVIRGGIGTDVPTLFGFEVPRVLSIGFKNEQEAAGTPIHGRSAYDRPGAMDGVER